MNKFFLWIKYIAGGILCLAAVIQFTQAYHPLVLLGELIIGGLLLMPPKLKVRGKPGPLQDPLSLKQILTPWWLLSASRWTLGFFYSLGAMGMINEKQYVSAAMAFTLGVIFISPLDRFFFPRPDFSMEDAQLRRVNISLIVLRNAGAFFWFLAPALYYGNEQVMGYTIFAIGAVMMLIAAFVNPEKLLSSTPATFAEAIKDRPGAKPQTPVEAEQKPDQPDPIQDEPKPVQPGSQPPVAPAKLKKVKKTKYRDGYTMRWTLKPSRINEAYFNELIREYEVTWLAANEYEERMRIHRNPEEYKENMIIVLNAYIEQIRARPELNYPGDTSTVPDLIDYVWKSDKRLRSLFNAMKHYSTLRNTKKIWVIMAHVAEYRAMINLVKRIKRSQVKMPVRTREEYLHTTLNGSIDPAIINALLRSGPSLPALNTENLTIVNEDTYFRIIDYIVLLGKNLENYKDLHDKFNEERYRDYFLPFLNAVSPHYSAKGEVFNRLGKTDILVCDKQGNNLFIAECKMWKGEAYLLNGVNQLLNTYVNWRDEKTAIIIFNRHVRQFSELVVTATEAMTHHPLFEHTTGQRSEASWSYLFRHPNDKNRMIRLELVLLNFV